MHLLAIEKAVRRILWGRFPSGRNTEHGVYTLSQIDDRKIFPGAKTHKLADGNFLLTSVGPRWLLCPLVGGGINGLESRS